MKSPSPSNVRSFRYEEITEGMTQALDYEITAEVYQRFLDTFHDCSPVHTDEAFAKSRGFAGRVMHGAILNGFVSHFIGVHFPGQFALLLSVDLRYARPSYLGDVIHVEMTVAQKMAAGKIIVLNATLSNITQHHPAARGRIQVMIKEEP
jgi:3-hydroxybutyryl-CoA dehydratase